MGRMCFGSCGGSGYLSCGQPCPACNGGGEASDCSSAPEGFEGTYFRGMLTGEIDPALVFENGGPMEEED